MDDTDLTDERIQALLDGKPSADAPPKVSAVLSELRSESRATPSLIPSGSLAEFLDLVELTIEQERPARPRKKSRAAAVGSAFVATAAGKLVLGSALAAATIGGAHAAEILDVPLLPDVHHDVEVETDGTGGEGQDPSGVADEPTDEDAPAETKDNHGTTVSDFVESTELEGCEKGQAVSEVASANANDHRQNPARDHDPCAKKDKTPDTETDDDDANTDPGDPGEAPGKSGEAPGKSGETPGKSGETPGKSGETPGKSGEAPGKSSGGGKPDGPGD